MSGGQAAGAEPPLRWGILGTGGIAAQFAADLALLPDAELRAVGSRSGGRAQKFAAEVGAAAAHGSYADLVSDDSVDVVYVATPHSSHCEDTLLALRAGKAVLCEKPFALDAAEARAMVEQARSSGRFLMEAMWSRFLPHLTYVHELVSRGDLGDVRTVTADHGQHFAFDPAHRMFDPWLGGGALLDLGVYPVSFATWMLGPPASVTAVSDPTASGVDAQTSMVLRYPGGAHASLTCTLEAATANRAAVCGTRGRIDIERTFYAPTGVTVSVDGEEPFRHEFPLAGRGLHLEAAEVMRCVRTGRLESEVMPLGDSVAVMTVLDEVRRQIGLTFPRGGR